MRLVCSTLLFACMLIGCGGAARMEAETPQEDLGRSSTKETNDAGALLVELDAREADDVAIENLREAIRRSSLLALDPSTVSPDARRLLLRFEATRPTQAGASLERTLSLTGFTNGGGCQIFKLSPKLTKPGGREDNAADVDALTSAGVASMVGTLEGLAPKIGPNASCVATGR